VKKLADANRKGKPLPEPEQAKTKVVNSMVALRSSLAQAQNNSEEDIAAEPPNAAAISFGPQSVGAR
jgi:hypothetical protein